MSKQTVHLTQDVIEKLPAELQEQASRFLEASEEAKRNLQFGYAMHAYITGREFINDLIAYILTGDAK